MNAERRKLTWKAVPSVSAPVEMMDLTTESCTERGGTRKAIKQEFVESTKDVERPRINYHTLIPKPLEIAQNDQESVLLAVTCWPEIDDEVTDDSHVDNRVADDSRVDGKVADDCRVDSKVVEDSRIGSRVAADHNYCIDNKAEDDSSHVDNEVAADGGDHWLDSDSGSLCVAEGSEYSAASQEEVAITRTIGLQTDESDFGVSTFSTFVCLLTHEGAATQVVHSPADSQFARVPSIMVEGSREWHLSYLVYS